MTSVRVWLRRIIGYPLVERQRQRQNRRRNGQGRLAEGPTERLGSLQERLNGQAHPETLAPPPSSDPAKPRPGNIHSSLHLSEAFYEALGEAAGMVDLPSRRAVLRATAEFALAGPLLKGYATRARAKEPTGLGVGMSPQIDSVLHAATTAEQVPGVVALAASDHGIEYEGVFGKRQLQGPAMTRDTVFRVASMIKPITSVAVLQLVERGKLSLDAPVPNIDPALGSPQVLAGFDTVGTPRLRAAKWPITLRHLLSHTSGFTYRLWDAEAVKYFKAIERLPSAVKDTAPRTPLMFDPGDRWQYGAGIDWVGRIVESISGESLDQYFRKNIFEPLDMEDTGFGILPQQTAREASVHRRQSDGSLNPQPTERQTAQQRFSGGGGIYSTGPDYLTFIRMLMQGGSLDGVRILQSRTVALMGQEPNRDTRSRRPEDDRASTFQ